MTVAQRFNGALFWVLLAALVIANTLVAWQSLTVFRLWEDEAFNLTVPLNLLAGLGYTSDGALSGSTLTPFDPRISTGVSVLLPVAGVLAIAGDPVMGARLIPLLYWMLLLAGLYVLGRRIAGRWGGLVAASMPLAFETFGSNSPIQGPADLLGEIPAAALIVWALVVLPRRTWLAGLLLGLALQAKLIAFIALPAFAVALWALTPGSGWSRVWATLRRSIVPLLFVALPTVLVELAAFIVLMTARGFGGYWDHVRAFGGFLLGGGQSGESTTVLQKLMALLDAWFVPAWAVAALVALGVGVVIAAARRSSTVQRDVSAGSAPPTLDSSPSTTSRAMLTAYGLAALIGLVAFVGWWAQAAHTPLWVRHPAPGVFAFAPLLTAFAVRGVQVLWRRTSADRVFAGIVAAGIACVLVGATSAHVISAFEPGRETLQTQRHDVAAIAEWAKDNNQEWLAAHPWGAAVSAVVLSGTHLGLYDAPAMSKVPRLSVWECEGETLVDTGPYRLCAVK